VTTGMFSTSRKTYVSPDAIHLMSRFGEAMVLARINHELDRHLHLFQGHVKLLRLGQRHAVSACPCMIIVGVLTFFTYFIGERSQRSVASQGDLSE
jgi:hypothetical protein